jgi:hypothetical protein
MATATQRRASGRKASENGRKQRPAWTKKSFPIEVAVFEFPTENGPPNFSVKLTRAFRRDEDSEWESTDYLGGGDLLRAAKLLEAADAYVQERLESDYRARKEENSSSDVRF